MYLNIYNIKMLSPGPNDIHPPIQQNVDLKLISQFMVNGSIIPILKSSKDHPLPSSYPPIFFTFVSYKIFDKIVSKNLKETYTSFT